MRYGDATTSNATVAESERIQALLALDILDSEPDSDMDCLVETLASTLNFPMAFISFLDSDRQWMKSIIGADDLHETPREIAFCNHTIQDEIPLIVEDALLDSRFSTNPLVLGAPNLRAYAGIPIRTLNSHRVGTLCVADRQPRKVGPTEIARLLSFGQLLERLLHDRELKLEQQGEARRIEDIASRNEALRTRWRQLETSLNVGQWVLDPETNHVQWTRGVFRLHGLEAGAAPVLEHALSFYPEPDRLRLQDALKDITRTFRAFDLQLALQPATDGPRWVRVRGEAQPRNDRKPLIFGIIQDVTDELHIHERLERATNFDPITGAHNSQSFSKELIARITQNPSSKFALIYIGIPEFASMRQSFGMSLTDIMLKEMAITLRWHLSEDEFLARISHDTFAIITEQGNRIEDLGPRIKEKLSDLQTRVPILRYRPDLLPRCAVALYPDNGTDADRLTRAVETALHVASRPNPTAPDATVFFQETMLDEFKTKENATGFLLDAMEEDRVRPFLQPIIDAQTGKIDGLEALVRVRTAEGEIVSAGEFWPALMDPSIAGRVGFAMRDAVIGILRDWRERSIDFPPVSLNVSATDLSEGGMLQDIASLVDAAGLKPRDLKLEVTEHVMFEEGDVAYSGRIDALRRQGFRVSLDDFGTGFGTLTTLMNLPVDEVKIDKSFVQSIENGEESQAIVGAVLKMATELSLTSVAEGVETSEQVEYLRENGATHLQGFLFAQPMPAAEVEDLLRTGRVDLL